MEREFLLGVDFNLYVDKPTYESWLNLLKGLVSAKERDCQRFRKSRRMPATGPSISPAGSTRYKIGMGTARARSTSPSSKPVSYHSTYAQRQREQEQSYPTPATSTSSKCPSPSPRPGSKRNAAVAFSPTSASFSHLPAKRPLSEYTANTYSSSSTFTPSTSSSTNNNTFTPSSSISSTPSRAPQRPGLQIPEYRPHGSAPNSYSPLEGLQSFVEKMSIGASPGYGVGSHSQTHPSSHGSSTTSYPSQTQAQPQIPTTLVAAYAHDERRRSAVPQNLYFYTLACSPVEERDACLPVDGQEGQGEEGQRSQQEGSVNATEGQRNSKTRLRYHQPSSAQGRHGVGYGDEYPSAASAFTAASRGVSYGGGDAAGYRYPQAVQSASTSPNDLDVRRLGRRLGQQQQQCSPHKGFTQQQHYSPRYHSSQQASPQYQPPPPPPLAQHHTHTQQRAQQGTCSQHSSPLYRPLNSTQVQQQQQRGYHQPSPHLSRGTSPQYHQQHQHQPQPQQQQRHSRQMQQSQGLPRFHDNVWNTQPAVVAPLPPPHSFMEEEEVEVLTARPPPDVLTARQEVFVGIAAPAPKYALPVVQLREGDGEVEMYVDEDEEDDMFEEEEEEDEGMEEGDEEEREWALVEQHPQQQQQRRQQYHDATTTTATYGSNGNDAAYRSKETTYHSNDYQPREPTTAYSDHANSKTMYRPETATAATFANAGPPGVCFYPTPSLSAHQYPYPSRQYSSSRRW